MLQNILGSDLDPHGFEIKGFKTACGLAEHAKFLGGCNRGSIICLVLYNPTWLPQEILVPKDDIHRF